MINHRLNQSVIVLIAVLVIAAHAQADYTISILTDSGSDTQTAYPGDDVHLNVVLTGNSTHFENLFRLTFSKPGLLLTAFEWGSPFVTGGIDDFSIPQATDLPVIIDTDTWNGPAVDAVFVNFVDSFRFGNGTVLSVDLKIPLSFYDYGDLEFNIEGTQGLMPYFNCGFFGCLIVDTNSFNLNIVPEPETLTLMSLAACVLLKTHRRRITTSGRQ